MELFETVRLNMLFDVYGNLLTEAQKKVLQHMLHEGLTLSETAENLKISRQAVLDVQKKAEKKLQTLEERLGCLKEKEAIIKKLEILKSKANENKLKVEIEKIINNI